MASERPWHVPGRWYTSLHNWHENVRGGMVGLPRQVCVKDDTLREGEETPGVVFDLKDRVEIGVRLQDIGVAELEMPMASSLEESAEVTKEFKRAGIKCRKSYIYFRTPPYEASTWKDDIKRRIDLGLDHLTLSLSFSREDTWSDFGGEFSKEKVEAIIGETVQYAKNQGATVGFGWPNQTRTYLDTLKRFHKAAADAGVDRTQIYDSLGVGLPASIRHLVSQVKQAVGKTPVLIHVHNDFGMATANTLAGIEGGAEWCDLVVNGLGDRGGNASFEEVVSALEILYGVNTGIKLDRLYELSKFVAKKSGVKCQPHKAIVGQNSFMEESAGHHRSMHAAIVGGTPEAYVPYVPETVGRHYTKIFGTTTMYGGAIEIQLDDWGFQYSVQDIERVRRRALKEIRSSKKGYLSEPEFKKICAGALKRKAASKS